jgi:hypothetical protein
LLNSDSFVQTISGYYSGEEEAGEDSPLMKGRPVRQAKEEADSSNTSRLLNFTHLDEITFADE